MGSPSFAILVATVTFPGLPATPWAGVGYTGCTTSRSNFVSGRNPRKLAQLYHTKSAVTIDDQKKMYAAMTEQI